MIMYANEVETKKKLSYLRYKINFNIYAWQPFYDFRSPKGNFEKRLNLEHWLPNKFFPLY